MERRGARSWMPSLAVWILAALPCVGSDLSVIVSPGLGGVARGDRWTFVRVDCVNNGDSFEGGIMVEGLTHNDSLRPESHELPVSLPRGARKEFFVYFPNDPQTAQWRARLMARHGQSGRVMHEQTISSATGPQGDVRFTSIPDASVFLLLVADAGERSHGYSIPDLDPRNREVHIAACAPDEMPDRWIGYDSADAVVARPVLLQRPINDRTKAMLEWVGTGGHLIIVPRADESGPFHADWANLLGVRQPTTMPFPSSPLFVARYGDIPGHALRAVFEGKPDEVVFADESGPVLFRKRLGLGFVSFSAVDLIGPAWRGSPAANALWRDLLARERTRSGAWSRVAKANVSYDPYGQGIVAGLRQIPSLRPPSFAWIGAYLGLYLLVMVGVNYLVLRRLDRKEWSLFTFPVIALLFGVGAYWCGYFVRGGASVLHQIDMVELDSGETQGVGRSFLGLFSATREPCTLTFPRGAFPQYFTVNRGQPGPGARALPPLRVRETEPVQATVPIAVWTMRTFFLDEPVRVPDTITGRLIVSETNGQMQVDGWLENRLPGTFSCRGVLLGAGAFQPSIEIPASERKDFHHQAMMAVTPTFYAGTPSDTAVNSVFQWWNGERREPGATYVVGTVSGLDLESTATRVRSKDHRQQTIVAVRFPVTIAPGQKRFGPLWWEPSIVQVESGQVSPMTWDQRCNFYLNYGVVTIRYRLVGFAPGLALKKISIQVNPQLWATAGTQTVTVSVFRPIDGTWIDLAPARPTELDDGILDMTRGSIDFRIAAKQANVQFQPQLIQVTGKAE